MHEPGEGADGAAACRPALRSCDKTSPFRGVAATENSGQWRARIQLGKRTVHLGRYRDEKSAALAYDRAATMLYGPSAVLNLPDEPCCDAAAALHTAFLIQHALGPDAPAAVKKLLEVAPLRHGRVGGGGGAPGGESDSAPRRAAAAAPLGLLNSLVRSPPRGAAQLLTQTRPAGGGGGMGPHVGGGGRGPGAAAAPLQLCLRHVPGPSSERVPPVAFNAAADGRGDTTESSADTGSRLSSPSTIKMRRQGLAPAGCDKPEQQAAAGGRHARQAMFVAALECISRLLRSDPDLLTGYLGGVQLQTAAALQPQGRAVQVADMGAAAGAAPAAVAPATVAPAAATAAPVPAPASPPLPPPLVQPRERPAAEGERAQQRPRLERGGAWRGAGSGAKARVTLALRPSPAPLPAPAAAPASEATGMLQASLFAYLGRLLSA